MTRKAGGFPPALCKPDAGRSGLTLTEMARKSAYLHVFRLLHLYTGVFITPAVLFFALTGAAQTFGLHETNRDHPNYKPARWLVVLGELHKKQTAEVPVRHGPPPARPEASPRPHSSSEAAGPGIHPAVLSASPAPAPATHRHPLPLRVFFLIVAVGLFSSTLTGLTLTYKYMRNKPLITGLLAAGVVLPLVLIFV